MPLPEEYLTYIEQNTNALERFGDAFSTADKRMDYLVKQVNKMSLALKDQGMATGQTTQLRFQATLPPLTGDTLTEQCPWNAICTSVLLHFPPGCAALVDVAIGHSDTQMIPQTGYLALDAASPIIPVHELIGPGEQIWVTIANADAANPHTVTVALTLQRIA